jgi:plastin-1
MLLDDDYYNNAKLAISIARKLGATIFLVPEDIVEVRAKMVSGVHFIMVSFRTDNVLTTLPISQNLTFVGSLMVVDSQGGTN